MLSNIYSSVTTLVLFFILLFAYTKLAGPIPFNITSTTTTKTTTFDVMGEGKASIKPDQATIQAGVSAKGDTTKSVQDQINSTISKVSEAVKALGVDPSDIQTSNYSVNPNYEYSPSGQKQNGFMASTNLTIKVKDTNKVGPVIDAATGAGATNVNNLGFSNTDQTSAENEARKKAVEDAKKKAQMAAQTAGFKLGKIVNYSENSGGNPRPVPFAAGATADSKATPIETGTNEVNISVTLSYEID